MGAAGPGAAFDPVRIQKLLFMIDWQIPDLVGGPHFDFQPYGYGPFDQAVYRDLGELIRMRYVTVDDSGLYPLSSVTESGQAEAESLLSACSDVVSEYLTITAEWVLSTGFRPLVAAVYDRYPEMAAGSKMRFARSKFRYPAACSPQQAFIRGDARAFDMTGDIDDGIPKWLDRASDSAAIAGDWRKVGDALRHAMRSIGKSRRA